MIQTQYSFLFSFLTKEGFPSSSSTKIFLQRKEIVLNIILPQIPNITINDLGVTIYNRISIYSVRSMMIVLYIKPRQISFWCRWNLYPLKFICKLPFGFQTDLNPIITSLRIADVTYKPLYCSFKILPKPTNHKHNLQSMNEKKHVLRRQVIHKIMTS